MAVQDVEIVRRDIERFDDGHQSICCYGEADQLVRVETRDANAVLKIAIDYHYDEVGNNTLRVVRDPAGVVLREIHFDASGTEMAEPADGPVRWKSLDGSEEGLATRGEEDIYAEPERDS
jgi:hypothetical protein